MSQGRRSAEERLRRLLVMLPWLMERGETPLVDVARHFDLTPSEVAADLELASMCGLPPFVDEMIDVFIDEDVVHVGVPRLFTRPLRLTAPEGFALVAAGRVAMQLPGADPTGPLGRGLRKLETALGDDGVVVDLPRPPGVDETLGALTEAVRRVEQLDIRYWTASRDEVTERTITPRRVFSDHGDWYVAADDQRSGEPRTFRVDRIEAVTPTGRYDEPAEESGVGVAPDWFADGGLPQVTLRLRPAARWVTERYPVDHVRTDKRGVTTATFPVASRPWLERMLLRLGPHATVIDPDEWAELGADTARRVLARYER
ncbi:MAG: helix-turn-helix transcriptional regulator [Desertimonas sp.]